MRFSLEVSNDPDEAFTAVADFEKLEGWDPFVDRSELVAGAPMEPGAKYRLTTPRGMTLEYEIVEVDRPSRVVYRGGTKRVTSTDTISVHPHDGGSRVTVESILEFDGWTRIIGPFVRMGVWLGGRTRSLPGMKRYLEELGDPS